MAQLWGMLLSALRRDIALSPALRRYRFSILNGDTGRFATKSRLPPSRLVVQVSSELKLQKSRAVFCERERTMRRAITTPDKAACLAFQVAIPGRFGTFDSFHSFNTAQR